MQSRSLWFGLVGTTVGGGVAGFSAALLFGVQAGFSQPLATFLAGAGALSAGLLAYLNGQRSRELAEAHHKADMDRERERHQEDSRHTKESALRDRYTAIATQIAHESAAIRQAGVYALTALADDWHVFGEDDERQVCINLLQWYLRVPLPQSDDAEQPDRSEREVRQTIVGILTQRRRRPPGDPKSWASTSISLSQASLRRCSLTDFNLAGLDLSNADLTRANLRGADLTNTNLTNTILYEANLYQADLAFATLAFANLTSAKLRGTNLTGANLLVTDLTGANLSDAENLTSAKLAHGIYDETTRWPKGFTPPPPWDAI